MDDVTAASFPNDLQTLKSMTVTLVHERDAASRKAQQLEVEKLCLEVELLRPKKWHYGREAD